MIEFHIITVTDAAELLSERLIVLGADAVTMYTDDMKLPDAHISLETDEVLLVILFENDLVAMSINEFLEEQQKEKIIKQFTQQTTEEKDWIRASLDLFKPMQFGQQLWICPTWETPPAPDAINIFVNPGLAFGTGTHPTTALCLEWIEAAIKGGETVIDYGCGSGLLAIAAIKLGAKHVIAIDNDSNALIACKENAEHNDVLDNIEICTPNELAQNTKVDVILANILAEPLKQLAKEFSTLLRTNGRVVLSGILQEQIPDIDAAYQPYFELVSTAIKEDWVRMEFVLKA